MKVLLTEDVDTLGYKGEIFEVAAGYGRNYLIPQGFAVPATPGQLKQAERWLTQAAARRDQMREEHSALVERLSNTSLSFRVKAGEKGRLYGSITTAEIASALLEAHGIEIDRRKITIPGKALRQIGDHSALVRFDADYQATITLHVIDEAAEKEAAAAAQKEAEAAAESESEAETDEPEDEDFADDYEEDFEDEDDYDDYEDEF